MSKSERKHARRRKKCMELISKLIKSLRDDDDDELGKTWDLFPELLVVP